MARVYGYMDDETGVFTPVGGGQSGNAYGGNGYAPRRVGYGVESMYNPNASYSFPRNNVNAQYGPWYGRQSYATRAPYAPNQPYYERVTGSNGRPVTMRFGEYQREQPVAYETMFNSQGVPVRVPVYGSGAPQQTQQAQQAQQPQQSRQQAQTQVRRNTPRVRVSPQPLPVGVSSTLPMLYNQPIPPANVAPQYVPSSSIAPDYGGWDWGVAYQPGSYTPPQPRMSSVPQSEWDDSHQAFVRATQIARWQEDFAKKIWDKLTSGGYTEEEMREKMKAIDAAIGSPSEDTTKPTEKTP